MKEFGKKYWKWIMGGLILLLSVLFLLHESWKDKFFDRIKFMLEVGTYTEEEFIQLDIQTTNIVRNDTKYSYLDTIVKVGLKEMGLDDKISVIVKPISEEVKRRFDTNLSLEAHIIGSGNQYLLFIDDMSRYEAIKVISHELVHLRQYRNGDLVIGDEYVIWKGKRIDSYKIYQMEYEQRPWELEAYVEQKYLSSRLNTILYGE